MHICSIHISVLRKLWGDGPESGPYNTLQISAVYADTTSSELAIYIP